MKHHINCIFILNYFYNNIDTCFFKVVVKGNVGLFPVRIFLNSVCTSVIFNGTQSFLSLVPRGRACISISSPGVWLRAFASCGCLVTAFVLSCRRKIWPLSGCLVTNRTSPNTLKMAYTPYPLIYLFSFQKDPFNGVPIIFTYIVLWCITSGKANGPLYETPISLLCMYLAFKRARHP